MKQLTSINERAYAAAIRFIGGDPLLNAITTLAGLLDAAEDQGQLNGYAEGANDQYRDTFMLEHEGFKDGYIEGVKDARLYPDSADATCAQFSKQQPITTPGPLSDQVNTFENYGMTNEEIEAYHNAQQDPSAPDAISRAMEAK